MLPSPRVPGCQAVPDNALEDQRLLPPGQLNCPRSPVGRQARSTRWQHANPDVMVVNGADCNSGC